MREQVWETIRACFHDSWLHHHCTLIHSREECDLAWLVDPLDHLPRSFKQPRVPGFYWNVGETFWSHLIKTMFNWPILKTGDEHSISHERKKMLERGAPGKSDLVEASSITTQEWGLEAPRHHRPSPCPTYTSFSDSISSLSFFPLYLVYLHRQPPEWA